MELKKSKSGLVSILICSRDRRKALEALASSLIKMETDHSFKIIVVEETEEPSPIDGTTYVSHPIANRGIPYARNLALAHAKGEIIVFIDDDCVIHDQWLNKLLQPFEDDSVVGVQGGVTVPPETNTIGWVEAILGFPGGSIRRILEAKEKIQETREISTLNCAYRRWVINKVGGFEKRLIIAGEDYVLAKQACIYGRCFFVPDAMVSHEARGSLLKIWSWFIRRGRAEVDVIRTGKQEDMDYLTLLRGSLSLKLLVLFIIGIIFSDRFIILLFSFFLAYGCMHFVRYYKAWLGSHAPTMALVVLPMVKLIMGIAVDWGRVRGIIFD